MTIRNILLLGDERLYKTCSPIKTSEMNKAKQIVEDLHDTIINFKNIHGFGRAIAAPQIGESYRIIYMHLENETHHFINPTVTFPETEKFKLWDDCMSFPGLEVYVERYKTCKVQYLNLQYEECEITFTGDLSELFQHEYDHLDGVLAVQRAIDSKSFRYKQKK